jgi:uncharacterized protein
VRSSVLVSAIKFRGQPLEIVQMGVEGKVDIAISQSIIDETLRVLRLKFKTTEAELDATSRIMHSCGRMVQVDQHFDAVPDDPKDDHIVDCAVAANADAIISGDHHLLDLRAYGRIEMLTVRDFLQRGIQN